MKHVPLKMMKSGEKYQAPCKRKSRRLKLLLAHES